MHMDSRIILLCAVINVFSVRGHASTEDDAAAACPTVLKDPTSLHLHAYGITPGDRPAIAGCSSPGFHSELDGSYRENHIVNVKNDETAIIYLTINGIHHGTTNSLPHYKEYKYEFALFSMKDVTWLVTVENMPSNNISYKFYVSDGSTVICRNEMTINPIKVSSDYLPSQSLLNWCKSNGIFSQQGVTSFSGMTIPQLANISITSNCGLNVSGKFASEELSSCDRVLENFNSPMVKAEIYRPSLPKFGCESVVSSAKVPAKGEAETRSRGEAFIIDAPNNGENSSSAQTINFEIVGRARTKDDGERQTIIVLRSEGPTHWLLHIENDLVSQNYVFVSDKNNEVVLPEKMSSSRVEYTNLDYAGVEFTGFIDSIEALYQCNVVSYMKYEPFVNLIYLKLGQLETLQEYDDRQRNQPLMAEFIFNRIEKICDDTGLYVNLPKKALTTYGLSANNLKFGNGNCQPIDDGDNVQYDLTDCGSIKDENGYKIELEFLLNSRSSSGIFQTIEEEKENIVLPLSCQLHNDDLPVVSNVIVSRCNSETFVLRIPYSNMKQLDLTRLSSCKNYTAGEVIEFYLSRGNGSGCTTRYEAGNYHIELPLTSTESYGSPETLIFSCRDSSFHVKSSYQMEVFRDFDLASPVEFPETVPLPFGRPIPYHGSYDEREHTYHVQVSITSNDPSLRIFLSECRFGWPSGERSVIIRHNCPSDERVSFVNSYESASSHKQHFAVKLGRFLREQKHMILQCEVSACSIGSTDEEIPTIPQCLRLHGDDCNERSANPIYHLAQYQQDLIQSGKFLLATRPEEASAADLKNQEVKDSRTTNWLMPLLLCLATFFLGCLLFCIIWQIDRRSYARPRSPLVTAKRLENNNSSGSGSSHSTASTRATESTANSTKSSSSLFSCFRREKETTKPTMTKEDPMLMAPLMGSNVIPVKIISNCRQYKSETVPLCETGQKKLQGVVQDGRHMYVSGGAGYLRMPIKSTWVGQATSEGQNTPEDDGNEKDTDNDSRCQKMNVAEPSTSALDSDTSAEESKEGNFYHGSQTSQHKTASSFVLPLDNTPEKGSPTHLGHCFSTNTSPLPPPPQDSATETLRTNAVLGWRGGQVVVPVSRSKFDALKEVAL